MAYLSEVITAFIGAIIALLFWKIEKKIDKMEAENNAHHKEQVQLRKAEREVLLAVADTTILTAKKVNDSNSVNGELEKSIEELEAKKKEVQDLTREIFYEHLE